MSQQQLVAPAIIKKKEISQKKLMFARNELMYNFLLLIRVLIANRFCYICDLDKKPYQ